MWVFEPERRLANIPAAAIAPHHPRSLGVIGIENFLVPNSCISATFARACPLLPIAVRFTPTNCAAIFPDKDTREFDMDPTRSPLSMSALLEPFIAFVDSASGLNALPAGAWLMIPVRIARRNTSASREITWLTTRFMAEDKDEYWPAMSFGSLNSALTDTERLGDGRPVKMRRPI